jgi:hypothetical protein
MKKSEENWIDPGLIWKSLLSWHSCLKKLYLSIFLASGRKFVREDDDGPDQDADGVLRYGALMGKNIQHNASSGTDCTNKMKRFARN